MVGFASIAKEAGLDVWSTTTTTLVVWGLPGQVAFVSLLSTGASLIFIFIAVCLANMRMMLMVISAHDILQLKSFEISIFKKILLMHLLAITSWAQLGHARQKYGRKLLLIYYVGFSITIYLFGLSGTLIGYHLDNFIPRDIMLFVVFITPIYILLLILMSTNRVNRLAVVLGALICPAVFTLLGPFSILIAGVFGGSLAFLLFHRKKKNDS